MSEWKGGVKCWKVAAAPPQRRRRGANWLLKLRTSMGKLDIGPDDGICSGSQTPLPLSHLQEKWIHVACRRSRAPIIRRRTSPSLSVLVAPPKLRPPGEARKRETSRVEDQVPSVLRDPKWVSLPFFETVIRNFGRASRGIRSRRRPLNISSGTSGFPYNLWRILRARTREAFRAKSPTGERVRKLTASCLAAGRHGASTFGSSIRLQQLSDHRATANGFTSE